LGKPGKVLLHIEFDRDLGKPNFSEHSLHTMRL
jgi:hypothetical protein